VSSFADIAIASTLAVGGIAMTPLPALLVAGTFAALAAFAFGLGHVTAFLTFPSRQDPHASAGLSDD